MLNSTELSIEVLSSAVGECPIAAQSFLIFAKAKVAGREFEREKTCREAKCASRRGEGVMSPTQNGWQAMLSSYYEASTMPSRALRSVAAGNRLTGSALSPA